MTPTQAQIDAALEAYNDKAHFDKSDREAMLAALTAAAEVGEQYVPKGDPRLDEVIGGPKKKPLDPATIERCARIAETAASNFPDTMRREIAAAIRALATEGK